MNDVDELNVGSRYKARKIQQNICKEYIYYWSINKFLNMPTDLASLSFKKSLCKIADGIRRGGTDGRRAAQVGLEEWPL